MNTDSRRRMLNGLSACKMKMPFLCCLRFCSHNSSARKRRVHKIGSSLFRTTIGRLGVESGRCTAGEWVKSDEPAYGLNESSKSLDVELVTPQAVRVSW